MSDTMNQMKRYMKYLNSILEIAKEFEYQSEIDTINTRIQNLMKKMSFRAQINMRGIKKK